MASLSVVHVLKEWLNNPYGSARVGALRVCQHIDEKDMEPIYEDVYFSFINGAPGYGNKSWTLRTSGYRVLGIHRFKEAIDLALAHAKEEGKFGYGLAALTVLSYNNLKPHWDTIEPILTPFLEKEIKGGHSVGWQNDWKRVLAEKDRVIELRSIEPFLTEAGKKAHRRLFPKDVESDAKP